MRSGRGASAYSAPAYLLTGPLSDATPREGVRLATPRRTWTDLIDDLLRIRNYGDDWDGEGSEALAPALIDGAITLAQRLESFGMEPANRVLAGVNGTVSFEWQSAEGYREIEVTSPVDAEDRWVANGSMRAEAATLSWR